MDKKLLGILAPLAITLIAGLVILAIPNDSWDVAKEGNAVAIEESAQNDVASEDGIVVIEDESVPMAANAQAASISNSIGVSVDYTPLIAGLFVIIAGVAVIYVKVSTANIHYDI